MPPAQAMTITERNQQIYELNKQVNAAEVRLQYLRRRIRQVKEDYERQQRPDLFTEMFS
tara:strand:+ start:502 stop:678 length:177 start_codon:yes stop_codon:yes gene_type:complete